MAAMRELHVQAGSRGVVLPGVHNQVSHAAKKKKKKKRGTKRVTKIFVSSALQRMRIPVLSHPDFQIAQFLIKKIMSPARLPVAKFCASKSQKKAIARFMRFLNEGELPEGCVSDNPIHFRVPFASIRDR
jgi:hypothetical protein